jgi:putative oxidoreductase
MNRTQNSVDRKEAELMDTFMMRSARATHSILRIGAGLFFMLHGGQKLLGWFGGFGGQPGATAPLGSLMGLAGILELVGGALIVLGLVTRPVAFLLAGEMAVAYFWRHFPQGFWPIENRGEPAALFALIFLFLAANGAGPLSLDALLGRGRRVVPEAERMPARVPEPAMVPEPRPVPMALYTGPERRTRERRERERRAS